VAHAEPKRRDRLLVVAGNHAECSHWRASTQSRSHENDRLNRLHDLVCSGQLSLRRAQRAIATNCVKAYNVYVLPI
jgi:hypothetical protein